ncbi:MAG: FHA domain-containing protein [Lachnospiraceae bacterium]|nr:FHA domain-containing protein [Lachnospiraceae bacterium]
MNETMPDISFERSMNHNYMILHKCDFFGKGANRTADYRTRMLLENRIPGLLPVTHRLSNGESRYYYEINSLQSLDRVYDKNEIGHDALRKLLSGCVRLFDRLEEYLLDGTQILIKSQFIYVDVEKMEPYFVCYPEYAGDVRLAFMEFVDELLTRIDHTDACAVMLGYRVYRYTRNPNYVMCEIGSMLDQVILNMDSKPPYQQEAAMRKELETMHPALRDVPRDADKLEMYRIKPPVERNVDSLYEYDTYSTTAENDGTAERETPQRGKLKDIGDLIGGIFCVFVSLCAGAIVLGARLIKSVELSGNNELYLCGAVGMAGVAGVLFFACYAKKRKQDKAVESLHDDYSDDEDAAYYSRPQLGVEMEHSENDTEDNFARDGSCPETVCLGSGIVEERVLCGKIDGREIQVILDKLPMTVGKLANVVDFVINDTAVSKMHARFEERDGRVYVCDLNSTNGTVRNGELLGVNQSVALEPGDRLRFGRTCFTYC